MASKEGAKKATKQPSKCYHCGGFILNDADFVIRKVPLHTKSGIRNYKRTFHLNCMSNYSGIMETEKETKLEQSWWDKCYFYFKELLDIPEGKNLDEYAVKRLLGLRVGKFMPAANNVRGLKRGYDFETILMTMKFSSVAVKHAMNTTSFTNQEHKVNYAIKIIASNLNFVSQKVEGKRIVDKKLAAIPNITLDNSNIPEYHVKGRDESTKKVSEVINTILAKSYEEDDELKDIDALFE